MCKTKLCQTCSLGVTAVSEAKRFSPNTELDTCSSESVSDLWPPVYGPFKAISARLVVQDGLFDLLLCAHHKWTWGTVTASGLRSLNVCFSQLKVFLLKRLSTGVSERGWLEHWEPVGNDHQWRTVLHHRLLDWLSGDQHQVRGFRTLSREQDAKYSSEKCSIKKKGSLRYYREQLWGDYHLEINTLGMFSLLHKQPHNADVKEKWHWQWQVLFSLFSPCFEPWLCLHLQTPRCDGPRPSAVLHPALWMVHRNTADQTKLVFFLTSLAIKIVALSNYECNGKYYPFYGRIISNDMWCHFNCPVLVAWQEFCHLPT